MRIRVLLSSHIVPTGLLVLLLETADLLLFGLEIRLKTIILGLELINLMLEVGNLSVPSRLLSLVR